MRGSIRGGLRVAGLGSLSMAVVACWNVPEADDGTGADADTDAGTDTDSDTDTDGDTDTDTDTDTDAGPDATGDLAWAKSAGGADTDEGYDISAFPDGSAIVTGYFQDTATFGAGEPNETVLASMGGYGIFVAKYAP